jgi:hypothetical protein
MLAIELTLHVRLLDVRANQLSQRFVACDAVAFDRPPCELRGEFCVRSCEFGDGAAARKGVAPRIGDDDNQ